jgi:hypothetical protein
MKRQSRRAFLERMGLGGVVFASGLTGCAPSVGGKQGARDFSSSICSTDAAAGSWHPRHVTDGGGW